MSHGKPFLFLAAALLAALQGCDSRQATAPGDRSSEGTGAVALRLSQQNAGYLKDKIMAIQYQVTGPGMDTLVEYSGVDTGRILLSGIPCGTRIVQVDAFDFLGTIAWTGSDTIEVHPNRTTKAYVTLHRPKHLGGVEIDITLDSASFADSATDRLRYDTLWTREFAPSDGADTLRFCGGTEQLSYWRYLTYCTEQIRYPARRDTLWVDTITRRTWDTLDTECRLATWIDSTRRMEGSIDYRCKRFHYLPYASYDTTWMDTAVGTRSLDNYKWCSHAFGATDSSLSCRTGRYTMLPAGICEQVSFNGLGVPFAHRYPCKDSLLYNPPKDS